MCVLIHPRIGELQLSFLSSRLLIYSLEKFFANMIKSQTHLSSAAFELPKILDSLKHSSNTLTSIKFSLCHFSNNRFDALSHLTQLDSLQLKYCSRLKSNVIHRTDNNYISMKHHFSVLSDERMRELKFKTDEFYITA